MVESNASYMQDEDLEHNRSSTPLLPQALDNSSISINTVDVQQMVNVINPPRSTFYIIILTVILGGLQLAWSTEFSEGTPFLLSLGISKQLLALIWIAGPLSGTLGQPIVGIYSDNCNFSIGRRKPFIIAGCLATSFSLWYLSHSPTIIKFIFFHNDGSNMDAIKSFTIPFAAFGVYLLDFSISVIQAASRAFIVDCVPTNQQQIANAWAARMIGIFNIVGFWLGSIDLTKILPLLGDTQFKILASFAAIFLVIFTSVSCLYIVERNPQADVAIKAERRKSAKKLKALGIEDLQSSNILKIIKSLFLQTLNSINKLPPQVKIVCYAEFFAWIGYFPMLFYTTTYVGELYLYNNGHNLNKLPEEEKQRLLDESTRRGSLALLLHAITSLVVCMILPTLVKPMEQCADNGGPKNFEEEDSEIEVFSNVQLNNIVKNCMRYKKDFDKKLQLFTISKIWIVSHVVFILCMTSTFFIFNSVSAIVMFAFLGIPWGTALYAPFVLISEEISRIKDIKARAASEDFMSVHSNHMSNNHRPQHDFATAHPYNTTFEDDNSTADLSAEENPNSPIIPQRTINSQITKNLQRKFGKQKRLHPKIVAKYENYEHESGIILGIHNVFIAAPQVISSLMSSLLFWIFSKIQKNTGDDEEFDSSLGWVFRFGGLACILALWLSLKVKTSQQLMLEDEIELEGQTMEEPNA
ncbi:hypothetical protein PACTADRAFT_47844 [Pachysolen tannophilus NRRL Y-2460]|uniref:Sucrose transporter n=1 Tax=Pachysolen tannophilus NRRL Y-2460 TaxID=669874 RepID=A0A1E4U1Z0_PACTA|nr:hypothetical protein PACTADRAFT_47844 [Pachysolen tannophilus NRRL Y-2460]